MHHQALEHVDFLCSSEVARKTFALQWSVPLGSARGKNDRNGLSPLHAELAQRGGGGRDAKDFAYALDELGVRRSIRLGTHFLHIDALGLPEALLPALSLCADVIREPNITPEHLKSAKLLVNQGRRSIEDDPGNWHVITFVACMPRLLSIEVRTGVKMWWKQPTKYVA